MNKTLKVLLVILLGFGLFVGLIINQRIYGIELNSNYPSLDSPLSNKNVSKEQFFIEKNIGSVLPHYSVGCVPNSDQSQLFYAPEIDAIENRKNNFASSLHSANFSATVVTFLKNSNIYYIGIELFNGRGMSVVAPGECKECKYNEQALWFILPDEWTCTLHFYK